MLAIPLTARVTRRVWEKIAQIGTQHIYFVKIYA
jgi:hypothetical protein